MGTDTGDRVPPQRQGEPAGILVVVEIASDIDSRRADLVQRDVADEAARVDDPAVPHHNGRLETDAVQVELAALIGLVTHPPQPGPGYPGGTVSRRGGAAMRYEEFIAAVTDRGEHPSPVEASARGSHPGAMLRGAVREAHVGQRHKRRTVAPPT
ncbi:MAG: hypothetical protein J2P19_10750 [Pseudonocardia sp.]|nr:hypothetical protein [Pseudonocardia sp.]